MDEMHIVEEVHDPDIWSTGAVIGLLGPWELQADALRNFLLADPLGEALGTGVLVGVFIEPVSRVRLFSAMGGFRPRPAASATTATFAGGR